MTSYVYSLIMWKTSDNNKVDTKENSMFALYLKNSIEIECPNVKCRMGKCYYLIFTDFTPTTYKQQYQKMYRRIAKILKPLEDQIRFNVIKVVDKDEIEFKDNLAQKYNEHSNSTRDVQISTEPYSV